MFSNTTTYKLDCPYCGEWIEIVVDGSVDEQSYIEDCQVCCRPIRFDIRVLGSGDVSVEAHHEDEV